jgi:crotonobetainyl-CoA:carnitine CoA-transferase CaiB-like acyl-CoA transferase
MAEGPLAGIRVLEFSQIVAAPFCGCILSDQGADVVKVESPGGDPHRNAGAVVPGLGKRFQSLNRGKRGLAVNLQSEEGREVIYRLVPAIDVVIINYRVGVPARLGIDYDTLRRYNPRLIYAEITGFGSSGPLRNRAGTDIVGVAYSGLMVGEAKTDEDGGPVGITSSSIADYCAGFAAAAAINAALLHRERTGEGQKIETSLLRAALAIQDTAVMREPVHDSVSRDAMVEELRAIRARKGSYPELLEARTRGRMLRAAFRGYYGGYQTQDGAFLVLGALTPATRNAARRVLGITDDPSDESGFDANDPANIPAAEQRRQRIRQIMLTRTTDEWVNDFEAAGVPCAPVNVPEEMSEDPQVVGLGIMQDLVHPVTGPQRVVGPVATMSATPLSVRGPAPVLGADSIEVLREHGFSPDEIDALLGKGILAIPNA